MIGKSQKNGALTLGKSIPAILIFCLVCIAGIAYMNDFYATYGVALPANISNAFDLINATFTNNTNVVTDMQNRTQRDPGIAEISGTATAAKSMYAIITLPYNAVGSVYTLVTLFAAMLGIPTWIIIGITTLITFAVTIALIATLFGKRPGDT